MMFVKYEEGYCIGSGGLINGGWSYHYHVMLIKLGWYMSVTSGGRRPRCPQSRDGSSMVCTACGCKEVP